MPSAASAPAFDPGLNWPVSSHSIRVGNWWLPGWWRRAVIAPVPLLATAVLLQSLPASLTTLPLGLLGRIDLTELLGMLSLVAGLLIGILFLGQLRRQQPSTLHFFPDRLEIIRSGKEMETWRWEEIVTQKKRPVDVWIESEGSGRSSHSVICFELGGKKARRCTLPLGLNPAGPAEPAYANLAALRHAMLLGMLYCQPTLRIDWAVYKRFELSPRTLARHRWPKWIDRGLGVCAMAGLFAALFNDYVINASLAHPWLSIPAIVMVMLAMAIVWGLIDDTLAPDPEAPDRFGERHRRLMAWRSAVAPSPGATRS